MKIAILALALLGCHPGPKPTPLPPAPSVVPAQICLNPAPVDPGACPGNKTTEGGLPCVGCAELGCMTILDPDNGVPGFMYCVNADGCNDLACAVRGKS